MPSRATQASTGAATEQAWLKGINAAAGAGTGETSSPTRRDGQPQGANGKVPCRFFQSATEACKFDHSFASKEEKRSRCWHCGSTQHTQKDCPGKRQSPTKGRNSHPPTALSSSTTTAPSTTTASTLNQAAVQHQQAILDSLLGSANTMSTPAGSTLTTTSISTYSYGPGSSAAALGAPDE